MSEEKSPKQEIFDLFYGVQETVRSGGGKPKMKMAKLRTSKDDMDKMEARIKETGDEKLLAYYQKLRMRSVNIAPPPRPN